MSKPTIIASREQSAWHDAWTEYLCVERLPGGEWRLFSGAYDWIAEAQPFYNEETKDYDLPAKIEGKQALGVECGYVFGGELECMDESTESVRFLSLDDPHLPKWLGESEWMKTIDLAQLKQAIVEAGHSSGSGSD
jgi:hypothetical protein